MNCDVCGHGVDLAAGGYQLTNQYEDLLFCGMSCLVTWLEASGILTDENPEPEIGGLSPQDVVFCPLCDQVHPGESHDVWGIRAAKHIVCGPAKLR